MKHFTVEKRLRSLGPVSLPRRRASRPTPFQVVRISLSIAHLAAAARTSNPGAPITITGAPLGITTTFDVGIGTGSAQESAISPSRTALSPPKLTLRAPSLKRASPLGGFT